MSDPTRIIEVQGTEEKFRELLTSAFEDRPHEVDGNEIRLGGDKPVRITLHEQPDRQLGSLELPMEKVRFEFPDQSEEEADEFMALYRTHAMRPGGM